MVEFSDIIQEIPRKLVAGLLSVAGYNPQNCSFEVLSGDGSDRRFIRIASEDGTALLILPSTGSKGVKEARSCWMIGCHLHRCGVPVPEMLAHDEQTGAILCEDMGDTLLHSHVLGVDATGLVSSYENAIDILVNMQIAGAEGFRQNMCWDQPVYDRKTMLERESNYFLEACCGRIIGRDCTSDELTLEFMRLAELASRAEPVYFLHRDFQSRNIMVDNGRLRVIDFQGARFGPLGYDLASLINDPYIQLSAELRSRLLEHYVDRLSDRVKFDEQAFRETYPWLAIQRNLQILGAFAFLSMEKGKDFFSKFICPAAVMLNEQLYFHCKEFPALFRLSKELLVSLQGDG